MTSGIFMYVFMGTIAGYFSARLYKTMKGREWKKSAFLTATLYPGIVFGYRFIYSGISDTKLLYLFQNGIHIELLHLG